LVPYSKIKQPFWTAGSLKMCPETSVTNYQSTPPNSFSEKQRSCCQVFSRSRTYFRWRTTILRFQELEAQYYSCLFVYRVLLTAP